MGAPLSKDEQKVLDELHKLCQTPLKNLPMPMRHQCVILKKLAEQEAEISGARAEAAARAKLSDARLAAVTYVTGRVNDRQTEATLLLGALMRASGEYDQILATRASQSILVELAIGLFLTVLPELKVIGRITNAYVPKALRVKRAKGWTDIQKVASSSKSSSWEDLADEIMVVTRPVSAAKAAEITKAAKDRILPFAHSLDSMSKDAIDSIRNPLVAHDDLDEESQKRMAGFAAKNAIMTELITAIQRSLIAVSFFQKVLYRFIIWYDGENVERLVQKFFVNAGLDNDIAYNAADFDKFSDLILYDMLRAYVKTYFVVKEVTVDDPADLPQGWSDDDIEGLDEAQRKLIYQKFSKVPWQDRSRPPVSSYKDLLLYWGGTMKKMPGGIRKPTPFGYG
jgi:hypothetical protein